MLIRLVYSSIVWYFFNQTIGKCVALLKNALFTHVTLFCVNGVAQNRIPSGALVS